MKIGGPKGPPRPPTVTPPTTTEGADRSQAGKLAGATFAEVLGAAADGGVPQPALAELAARIDAGELSAAEAADQLVEAVVQNRIGGLSTAQQQQLRTSLRRMLADDPWLSAKVAGLGDNKGDEPR